MDSLKKQVDGKHYLQYEYQPVHFILDLNTNFCLGNAIKYVARLGTKKDKGVIGIDKAIHYLEILKDVFKQANLNDNEDVNTISFSRMSETLQECVDKFLNQFKGKQREVLSSIIDIEFEEDLNASIYKVDEAIKELNLLKDSNYAIKVK